MAIDATVGAEAGHFAQVGGVQTHTQQHQGKKDRKSITARADHRTIRERRKTLVATTGHMVLIPGDWATTAKHANGRRMSMYVWQKQLTDRTAKYIISQLVSTCEEGWGRMVLYRVTR